MKKVLFVICMLLMITSVGICQRTLSSTTDYFNVPTANILPAGDVTFALQASGDNIWGPNNSVGVVLDLGITDRLGVSATTDIKNFDSENIIYGAKFVVGPADQLDSGQLALFLYNIGDRPSVPGVSFTKSAKRLSFTGSGWVEDGNWQGGAAATVKLNQFVNLQAEYSTTTKTVYGVGLKYSNLFGTIRYLDNLDEFYGTVGVTINAW